MIWIYAKQRRHNTSESHHLEIDLKEIPKRRSCNLYCNMA